MEQRRRVEENSKLILEVSQKIEQQHTLIERKMIEKQLNLHAKFESNIE